MVALGGMHGCSGGACMVFAGGHAWFLPGRHAWFLPGGMHGCSWGGMHGFCRGACMVFAGGMHGFSGGVHVFFLGGCVVFPGGGLHRIRRDTVNERAVCILLECILVDTRYFIISVLIVQ